MLQTCQIGSWSSESDQDPKKTWSGHPYRLGTGAVSKVKDEVQTVPIPSENPSGKLQRVIWQAIKVWRKSAEIFDTREWKSVMNDQRGESARTGIPDKHGRYRTFHWARYKLRSSSWLLSEVHVYITEAGRRAKQWCLLQCQRHPSFQIFPKRNRSRATFHFISGLNRQTGSSQLRWHLQCFNVKSIMMRLLQTWNWNLSNWSCFWGLGCPWELLQSAERLGSLLQSRTTRRPQRLKELAGKCGGQI